MFQAFLSLKILSTHKYMSISIKTRKLEISIQFLSFKLFIQFLSFFELFEFYSTQLENSSLNSNSIRKLFRVLSYNPKLKLDSNWNFELKTRYYLLCISNF